MPVAQCTTGCHHVPRHGTVLRAKQVSKQLSEQVKKESNIRFLYSAGNKRVPRYGQRLCPLPALYYDIFNLYHVFSPLSTPDDSSPSSTRALWSKENSMCHIQKLNRAGLPTRVSCLYSIPFVVTDVHSRSAFYPVTIVTSRYASNKYTETHPFQRLT